MGATVGGDIHSPPQLPRKRLNDTHAERFAFVGSAGRRQANSRIFDRHSNGVFALAQGDDNFTALPVRERIFEGIRQQFIQDQPAWNGAINRKPHRVQFKDELNPRGVSSIRTGNFTGKRFRICGEVDFFQIARSVKHGVNLGHGVNATLTFPEC